MSSTKFPVPSHKSFKIISLETTRFALRTNRQSKRYSAFVNSNNLLFNNTRLANRSIEISPHSRVFVLSCVDTPARRSKARIREHSSPNLKVGGGGASPGRKSGGMDQSFLSAVECEVLLQLPACHSCHVGQGGAGMSRFGCQIGRAHV